MDEIRTTKLLIGNKLLELVDEEGRELIDGLSSRVSNLLDEYGVNMGTVRTVATLFESSTPSFGNVSTDSGYIDLEDALADYDEIEIKYNAFGKTGIVKAHPDDFAGSTIGSTAFHWSEIQTNNQISTDPERTVFRHMDFYATDISADDTNRLDVGAVVWGWNGDPSSAGKLSSTFVKSWNSEAGQWTSAGFVGGILSITGIKYTESGSTKDPELVDIRTGADGTVYDTAGDAVRGQVTALEGQIGTVSTDLAAAYDATQTYAVGDYCVEDGVLYKCTTSIATAEAWTAGHWTAVKVMPEMNAAVAGVNGEVQSLKEDLNDIEDRVEALEQGSGGSSLTEAVKAALLQIAQKVAYIDADGQDYYDDLYDALYPPAPPAGLVSIDATYTQTETVTTESSLSDLTSDLVVVATYDNSTTATLTSSQYTLSGTLTVGTSTITVSYGGKTDTFTVTVSGSEELWIEGIATGSNGDFQYSPFLLPTETYVYDYAKAITAIEGTFNESGVISIGYYSGTYTEGTTIDSNNIHIAETLTVSASGQQKLTLSTPMSIPSGSALIIGTSTDTATFKYGGTLTNGFMYRNNGSSGTKFKAQNKKLGFNVYRQ